MRVVKINIIPRVPTTPRMLYVNLNQLTLVSHQDCGC